MCRSLLPILLWIISCATLHADGRRVLAEKQASGGLRYYPVVGTPELGVPIRRNGRTDFVSFELPVDRALPAMLTWWPVVALMPLGIFLTIWHGFILKKRRTL